MKLYSGPLSLFTAKVRIALDEKALAYERVEVGWSLAQRYEPHHPDVSALNPKRQVPVLIDGELAVYDSTVILEYLEDRHPSPPLFPRDAVARARCRQLEAAADEIWFPVVWDLIEGVFYGAAGGERDARRVDGARAELHRRYDALEKDLSGRGFLCDAFSVADIGTFIMVNAAVTLGAPPGDTHARVRDWLARCRARPAVRREAEAMGAYAAKAIADARS
jgi:glutathione S-transferase